MLTIAQISDLHFNGTERNRSRVQATLDYLNRCVGPVDVVLATGDITDEGTPEQYAEAHQVLRTAVPMLIQPGNHDLRENFSAVFRVSGDASSGEAGSGDAGESDAAMGAAASFVPTDDAEQLSDALFVMLDSVIPGEPDGELSPESLEFLESTLNEVGPAVPVFVALHHPPATVGMEFMDSIKLRNPQALEAVVERHPNIVAFFSGHVHSPCVTSFAGRPLAIAPGVSSTLNLACENPDVVINESQTPGIAFHLWDGEKLITHFRQVPWQE